MLSLQAIDEMNYRRWREVVNERLRMKGLGEIPEDEMRKAYKSDKSIELILVEHGG